ncbi:MAG: glutaredoxin 3 [Rickettsiales bacterium]|jgi:glutaredoxin 3
MAQILIYKTPICPYCTKAKALLAQKNVLEQITEIDISTKAELKQEMYEKSGGRMTVPQIFINDTHIGGFDDLYALDKAGKLDELLA